MSYSKNTKTVGYNAGQNHWEFIILGSNRTQGIFECNKYIF